MIYNKFNLIRKENITYPDTQVLYLDRLLNQFNKIKLSIKTMLYILKVSNNRVILYTNNIMIDNAGLKELIYDNYIDRVNYNNDLFVRKGDIELTKKLFITL
jgi:hypothetical protein